MTDFLAFETFRRSRRPNNFLVAPEGLCQNAVPDKLSPRFPEPAEAVFKRLAQHIKTEILWEKLRTDPEEFKLKFIARTPLLRFRDDVDIQVLPGAGDKDSQIAIYSRSRLGHSDLGANAKRVRGLLTQLIAK